jgi:hypothetical protein
MYATVEELWEAVFSVDPCRGYIWRSEAQWTDENNRGTLILGPPPKL